MQELLKKADLKNEFKLKMLDRFEDVKYEDKKRFDIDNEILDTCPPEFIKIAIKAMTLQKNNKTFRINDFTDKEIYLLKELAKENNIPVSYVFNLLLTSPKFISKHISESRKIIKLLKEFDEGMKLSFQKYNSFPLNLLNPDSRKYLSNNARGLSMENKLRIILEVYRPDYKDINIETYNHEILPKSRQVISKEQAKQINNELAKFSNSKNNIDSIFLKENEQYFKNLCNNLLIKGTNFEDFIKNNTTYNYSKCFKIDILKGIKHMVNDYHRKYSTTVGITQNDTYLRSKIEAAQHVLHISTIKELFDKLEIENDNINNKDIIGFSTLKQREDILIEDLNQLYKDGIIRKDFTKKHSILYEEVKFLADRNNYDDINDYLIDLGFIREAKAQPFKERTFYLSEFDLLYYNFINLKSTKEEIAKVFNENQITQLDPYRYLGVYRKLIAKRQDVRANKPIGELKKYIK